jgi:hypothetical protein
MRSLGGATFHPDSRNDMRAIGYAAMALISDALFGT